MSLSVVIPVYNGEIFLKRAIESVLIQSEVSEIILIEDCSLDNSIQICKEYSQKYPDKIMFYQHPDKKNHGAGASRNLGISMATGKYIAFLDADDFYLPECFSDAIRILDNNSEIDGTYGILGVHFDTEEIKQKYNINGKFDKPTGIMTSIAPEDLFLSLITGAHGYFSLDTVVVKKELIEKCDYFNVDLRQAQDTHFIFKLTAIGKLTSSSLDKVIAMRGVHDDNRIHNVKEASRNHINIIPLLLEWAKKYNIKIAHRDKLINSWHSQYVKKYSMITSSYFWKITYLKTFFKHKIMFNYIDSYICIIKTITSFDMIKYFCKRPFWFFTPGRRTFVSNMIKNEIKGSL